MKIVKIILILLLFYSCKPYFSDTTYTLEEARIKISEFSYQKEIEDYWKSPREFEADGGGDCEDFCIYLMYLLGDDSIQLVVIYQKGIQRHHAILLYKGEYIDSKYPFTYNEELLDIRLVLDFYTVMERACYFGTKSIRGN